MLIDTHAHLYSKQFDSDRPEMMQRAFNVGLTHIFLPNVDSSSIEAMLALESAYPDRCFAMMGVHPCSIGADYERELAQAKEWLDRRPFVAVGEIGLDYYWSREFVTEQKAAFRTQLGWARSLGIPVAIHARDSMDDILDILEEFQDGSLRGVLHCFTGNLEQARRALALGFFLGLGGVLTYPKGGLEPVVRELPLDRLLLETDAPYLAPVPFRGKRNETAHLRHVAQKLAEVMDLSFEAIATATSANALRLFDRAPNP
jgi:TatD DNase family protein